MSRLLITGTREGWDEGQLSFHLGEHVGILKRQKPDEPVILVHGDAAGVDRQAAAIFKSYNLTCEPHPADWGTLGKSAGPIRNSIMVNLGADVCLAFPSPRSVGTFDCIRKALAAGIPVHRYERVWY